MKWVAAPLAGALLAVACGTGGTDIKHFNIPSLAGKRGQFDFALNDPKAHLFFAADKADHGVDVFEGTTSDLTFRTTVAMGSEPHGLTLAPDLHRVYVGNLDGTVQVIDVNPVSQSFLKVIAKINTKAPKGIDLMGYDPVHHKLFAASPDNSTLFDIDVLKNTVTKAITTKKGIEEPVFNPVDGLIYLTINPAGSLYRIDPVADRIISETKLASECGAPNGLAINPKTQQALIGCDKIPILWDLKHDRLIRSFGEVGFCDQVVYDPASDRFFTAGQNSNFIVAIFGGNPVRYYNTVQTHADSRAVAYDPATKVVFQPDGNRSKSGALAFSLPDPEPDAGSWWLPLLYLAGLVIFGAAIWFYGKRKAEERRRLGRPMFS